jgi:hypothetical protein
MVLRERKSGEEVVGKKRLTAPQDAKPRRLPEAHVWIKNLYAK